MAIHIVALYCRNGLEMPMSCSGVRLHVCRATVGGRLSPAALNINIFPVAGMKPFSS